MRAFIYPMAWAMPACQGASQLTFDQIEIEQAAPYAAEDADVTLRLHETLRPKLEAEPALLALLEEIEVPLIPVLSRIERTGVKVDAKMLASPMQTCRAWARLAASTSQPCSSAAGNVSRIESTSSPREQPKLRIRAFESTPRQS